MKHPIERYREEFPQPFRITIRIPVEVKTFGGIGFVTSALSQINRTLEESDFFGDKSSFKGGKTYKIQYFRIESDPQTSILSDPAWLAVIISMVSLGVASLQLLSSYSQLKGGMKELLNDLASLKNKAAKEVDIIVSSISGISNDQKNILKAGVYLYIDDILSSADNAITLLKRAISVARFMGANRRPIGISVDTDQKKKK